MLPRLRSDFPGITWTFEGNQAEMRESTSVLWGGFILVLIIMYTLLAVAFGSYVQPLIIMTAIPFGIVGAVIGHILLGFGIIFSTSIILVIVPSLYMILENIISLPLVKALRTCNR